MSERWGPSRDDASHWFRRELRLACDVSGLTQSELARRVGISRSRLSRLLAGVSAPDLDLASALARGAGHRLVLKVVPGDGVRLRDSGQLTIAGLIAGEAHGSWRKGLEVPVASPPDLRAADLVLSKSAAVLLFEIERWLRDLQAQLRAAQLKRAALSELLGRRVDLVLAVLDTRANRRAAEPHTGLIAEALPVSSRAVWAAVRSGEPLGGDGLLWVRDRGHRQLVTDGNP